MSVEQEATLAPERLRISSIKARLSYPIIVKEPLSRKRSLLLSNLEPRFRGLFPLQHQPTDLQKPGKGNTGWESELHMATARKHETCTQRSSEGTLAMLS